MNAKTFLTQVGIIIVATLLIRGIDQFFAQDKNVKS
jgi:hypothetical protein